MLQLSVQVSGRQLAEAAFFVWLPVVSRKRQKLADPSYVKASPS
jgi:hypothetical protein